MLRIYILFSQKIVHKLSTIFEADFIIIFYCIHVNEIMAFFCTFFDT